MTSSFGAAPVIALAVLGLALVVALGAFAYRREQARQRALRAWAAAGGWQLVDANGNVSTTRRRQDHDHQVVALRLPVRVGPVQVVPAGFGQRVVTAFGGQDIEVEHADFNRRRRVTAASPKLAIDLLSPRVVEQLLDHEDVSLRVADGWALAWGEGRLRGPSVDERLTMLRAVVDGIPRFVWLDHGHDPVAPR